jgi:RNA polymerase sigma-70 factor (ECF subfamily)
MSKAGAGERGRPGAAAPSAGGASASAAAEARAADAALVERLADGEVEALGLLFERHGGAVLALARRMVADEADDLVHDVFVEAWRHAAGYEPARASVRTWLLVRCRSRALDRLRSARGRRTVALETEPGLADWAAPEGAGVSIDGARAWEKLGSLPAPQRQVIELAYFGGLSASEIAVALDVPIGTVKSRTAAALRALRGLLGEGPGGGA